MKEAKRVQITEQLCKQALLMRKGGANQTEIGMLLGVNPCTISRIEAAGYDLRKYTEMRKIRRETEEKRKQEKAEQPTEKLALKPGGNYQLAVEEQVPGQVEMELVETKPQEMSDQVKMMRFQAAQVDKLVLKLDHINDTLSMILRVMRKE